MIVPILAGLGAVLMGNPFRKAKRNPPRRRRVPVSRAKWVKVPELHVKVKTVASLAKHYGRTVYFWLIADSKGILAQGDGYCPAGKTMVEHKRAVDVLYMAMQALPKSGSGIAGDEDSLKVWSERGRNKLDTHAAHDAISMLVEE